MQPGLEGLRTLNQATLRPFFSFSLLCVPFPFLDLEWDSSVFDRQAQSCHSAARTPATLGRVSKHGVQYACCLPTPEMPFSSLFFTQPALLPCPGVFFTQAPLTWVSLPFLWDNYIFPSPGKPSPLLSLQSPRWVRNISRDIWFYFLKCVSVCVCTPLWPGLGIGSPGDGVIFVLETLDGGAGTQSMALW